MSKSNSVFGCNGVAPLTVTEGNYNKMLVLDGYIQLLKETFIVPSKLPVSQ